MSRPPATSRKVGRVLVLLALFLVCQRATQTARALLGAGAVPFPRSVPPKIWAQNLLVARRAKADGTLGRGEAEDHEDVKGPLQPREDEDKASEKDRDEVEEATTEVSRKKAVDEAASAQTADPVEDAKQASEPSESEDDEDKEQAASAQTTDLVEDATKDLAAARQVQKVAINELETAQQAVKTLTALWLEELKAGRSDEANVLKQEVKEAEKKVEKAKQEVEKAKQEVEKAKEEAKASVGSGRGQVPDAQKAIQDILCPSWTVRSPRAMMPQLIAREEAKDQILEYIRGALSQDDYYWESGSNINKCAVLTTAGIKGTGKTRVLHEMCTTWRDETGAKAAVTVDFNGGSYWDHSKAATEVFSKLLLQQSGMPAEKAENCAAVLSFKQVMQCLREKLNLGADDLLLVGIDEIRQFETLAGKDRAVQLVSNLMGAQDESLLQTSNCPVIFVWTSMLESYMSTLMSDSGRYVLLPISLRGLPLVEALQLLPEELREELDKEPSGRQLVRQLLGHPRLMFDALRKEYFKLKKPPRNPLAWNQLQRAIVTHAKLGDRKALDSVEVIHWWSPLASTTRSVLEDLRLRGIVHSVRCGSSFINILHPVMLQLWARSDGTSLAGQINEMFEQDAVMEDTNEKKFEDIMVHFDCAVRLALGKSKCTLEQLFHGASFRPTTSGLQNVVVTSTQNVLAPLEYVKSFVCIEEVLQSLKSGKIVVSKLRNEPGIEYLIPWMVPDSDDRRKIRDLKSECNKTEAASLLVLGIQTKCVSEYVPSWPSVAKKAEDALAVFQNHPDVLGALPVFYTTEVRVDTPNLEIPSIYFSETGLAELMLERTGPLRLFFEKPGDPLKKMLPDFFEQKKCCMQEPWS